MIIIRAEMTKIENGKRGLEWFKEAYAQDPLVNTLSSYQGIEFKEYAERIYVSGPLEIEVIKNYHDGIAYGHPEVEKTMELIRRNYDFPGIREKITRYIKLCVKCQRAKTTNHKTYGRLQHMEIPNIP